MLNLRICKIKASGILLLATPAPELNLWDSAMRIERKMHGKLICFSLFKGMTLTYSLHLSLHLIATQPILPYSVCY